MDISKNTKETLEKHNYKYDSTRMLYYNREEKKYLVMKLLLTMMNIGLNQI
tara:strand:+ start:402 stop:554 length:153 start_codon:yes stop_codon:yes gene_type:complete